MELNLYSCSMFRCFLLKNNKIKLIGWNVILIDINVADIWQYRTDV